MSLEVKWSPQIDKLAAALSKAQGKIKTPQKNKTAEVTMKSGGKYSYSYSDLASLLDAIREPLAENELSLTQPIVADERTRVLVTMLLHSSGQWLASHYSLPFQAAAQEMGSAITYARRYSIGALLNVSSEEDDDGKKIQETQNSYQRKNAFQGQRAASHNTPAPGSAAKPPVQPVPHNTPITHGNGVRDKSAIPATDKQRGFVYGLLKKKLGLENDLAKAFMKEETGKDSSRDLTMADVDKISIAVERELKIKAQVHADINDAQEPPENAKPGDFNYPGETGLS